MCPYLFLISHCPLWPEAHCFLLAHFFLYIVLKNWAIWFEHRFLCVQRSWRPSKCVVFMLSVCYLIPMLRSLSGLFFIISFVFASPALCGSSLSDLSSNSLHALSPSLCFTCFLAVCYRLRAAKSLLPPNVFTWYSALDLMCWMWHHNLIPRQLCVTQIGLNLLLSVESRQLQPEHTRQWLSKANRPQFTQLPENLKFFSQLSLPLARKVEYDGCERAAVNRRNKSVYVWFSGCFHLRKHH